MTDLDNQMAGRPGICAVSDGRVKSNTADCDTVSYGAVANSESSKLKMSHLNPVPFASLSSALDAYQLAFLPTGNGSGATPSHGVSGPHWGSASFTTALRA